MDININVLLDEANKVVSNILKTFCEGLIIEKQKECLTLQEELVLSDNEIKDLQENNSLSLTITEYDDTTGTEIFEEVIPPELCKDEKKHFFILSKPSAESSVIYKSIDCSQEYKEELLPYVYTKYTQDNLKRKILNSLINKYTKLVEPFYEFNKIFVESRKKQKSE